MAVHCLMLCGGAGSRLWPSSRIRLPKPFIPLFPDGALYEQTMKRASTLEPASIIVVASGTLAPLCEAYACTDLPLKIKCEPMGRNTLPATILGCKGLEQDDIVIMMPCDHAIDDVAALKDCLSRAVKLAERDYLVTLGIEPGFPATGYGYIETGEALDNGFVVNRFVEKPNEERAREMVEDKGFYWNSGVYVFKVQTLKDEVARQTPQLGELFEVSEDQLEAVYAGLKSLSIDYGIAEKAERMAMVPAYFDWDDLGSWRAVWNKTRKGPSEISVSPGARFLSLESRRLLLHSDQPNSKIYVAVGVNDLAIVDTGDAMVVAHLDHSDGIRKAWDQARMMDAEVVERPCVKSGDWGRAEELSKSDAARLMRLVLEPGARYAMRGETAGMLQVNLVKGYLHVQCDDEMICPIRTVPHFLPNEDMVFINPEDQQAEVFLTLLPSREEPEPND